jgi:multicomponent Na+:H+ antiporter subunit F
LVNLLLNISAGFALAAIILSLVRLIKGPTTADRTVALDTMTIVSISLIVFIATLTRRIIYYDVAMVYALLSFIGVVAIARYLERGL